MRSRLNRRQIESPSTRYTPLGLPVPIATSGRYWTTVHACSATATTTHPVMLVSERIFDDLPFRFDQGFDPASAGVMKHSACVVGRDEVMAVRAYLSARRIDQRRAERL